MNKVFCVLFLLLSCCGFTRPENKYYKEAITYKNEGETHKAIESLRKVISTNPKSSEAKDALFLLGDLYYQIGDAKKAMKVLNTYIDISDQRDKRRFDVFNKMGLVIYSKVGDYPRALKYYKDALLVARSKGNRFDVYLNVGNCYFKMYRFDKAFDFFGGAVKELKNNPDEDETLKLQEALYYMSLSYLLLTKDSQDLFTDPQKKIIEILDECIHYSISSKYGIMCKYQKAETFEELGLKDKAVAIYTELKDVYPNKGVIEAKLSKLTATKQDK